MISKLNSCPAVYKEEQLQSLVPSVVERRSSLKHYPSTRTVISSFMLVAESVATRYVVSGLDTAVELIVFGQMAEVLMDVRTCSLVC